MKSLKILLNLFKFYGLNFSSGTKIKIKKNFKIFLHRFLIFCGFIFSIFKNFRKIQRTSSVALYVMEISDQIFFNSYGLISYLMFIKNEKNIEKILLKILKFDEVYFKIYREKIKLKRQKLIYKIFFFFSLIFYLSFFAQNFFVNQNFQYAFTMIFQTFAPLAMLLNASILCEISERIFILKNKKIKFEERKFLMENLIKICRFFVEKISSISLMLIGKFYCFFLNIFNS